MNLKKKKIIEEYIREYNIFPDINFEKLTEVDYITIDKMLLLQQFLFRKHFKEVICKITEIVKIETSCKNLLRLAKQYKKFMKDERV